MTRHPIAQFAQNGNPKSPEICPPNCGFLQMRLLCHSQTAVLINGLAVLLGRLIIPVSAQAPSAVAIGFDRFWRSARRGSGGKPVIVFSTP
jgi:hypothetical protein